jgi:hypothetical protein
MYTRCGRYFVSVSYLCGHDFLYWVQLKRLFVAHQWEGCSDFGPISEFIKRKLSDVLHGHGVDSSLPPEIDLLCSHEEGKPFLT